MRGCAPGRATSLRLFALGNRIERGLDRVPFCGQWAETERGAQLLVTCQRSKSIQSDSGPFCCGASISAGRLVDVNVTPARTRQYNAQHEQSIDATRRTIFFFTSLLSYILIWKLEPLGCGVRMHLVGGREGWHRHSHDAPTDWIRGHSGVIPQR